ncbi:B3 domain-containing protein REM14 [Striga hermonthica]|uniref:B3 domain-containing protein REM14 n=1 Tax=Striga hermonthica TaxID=68872 RepID=A0A9N7NMX6_STRHE|nr:B3 domain-containing protein REM14 [Striga hermonthica]
MLSKLQISSNICIRLSETLVSPHLVSPNLVLFARKLSAEFFVSILSSSSAKSDFNSSAGFYDSGMDNMDFDSAAVDGPYFFKVVVSLTSNTMTLPPATHRHYRGVVFLQRFCIQTIEGRKYETTLTIVNNYPTLVDGWREFIQSEDLSIGCILVFHPRTIFDFQVWVMQLNGCERQPQFILKIKPTHVERARLVCCSVQ